MTSICLPCARSLHEECYDWDTEANKCCCSIADVKVAVDISDGNTGKRDGMTWSKNDGNIIDAKSTGRKRAAKIYPIEPSKPCEWQGLRYAGGGMFPILGCKDGKQVHRHHGPDLSTLNNLEGNVHRICTVCHNRWHADNDAFILEFAETILWRPHDLDSIASLTDIEFSAINPSYSRARYIWRAYTKDKHDYRDYLRTKEGSA